MEAHEFDIRIRQDGNRWYASFQDFEDLQVSPAGFGKTPIEAIEDLRKECPEPFDRML
jgi:hypothetical protein